MTEPRDMTLYEAGQQMRQGKLTAEALLESCIARIEQRESQVHAWTNLYVDEALRSAREMDKDAAAGKWRGILHGIPAGIKDIIHVKGMITTAGTEAYEAHSAEADAHSVAGMCQAGAIMLGKTVSTSFAYRDARETRNPWNTAHTPGGSSSGSGAAVGDHMCLAALGTQTGGSTLRPGAFNGIVGFKPSFGEIPTGGVLELSWHMDHVGVLARDVDDARLIWRAARNDGSADGADGGLPPLVEARTPARVGRLRGYFETKCTPEVWRHLEAMLQLLADNGVSIVECEMPASYEGIYDSWQHILAAESALNHLERYPARKELYPHHFNAMMEEGFSQSTLVYLQALRHRNQLKEDLAGLLSRVDAIMLPTAPTPPPDPSTTGDASFLSPWTMTGYPAISVPSGLSGGGLPLGMQLVTGMGRDEELLRMGKYCQNLFGFDAFPGKS
ncbi:MAG: amidase [SAR324 cluster bacterium]|nr:amidase [SAR324 cluster bacterium]